MNIKQGDLVMVVKPTVCCGNAKNLGRIFTVNCLYKGIVRCQHCLRDWHRTLACADLDTAAEIGRLKKIDPPTDGDSLPTRADMEVAA